MGQMSEVEYADPEDVGSWAEQQAVELLECRLLGHHWEEGSADDDNPDMHYVRGPKRQRKRLILCWHFCVRCRCVKRKVIRHPFTGAVLEVFSPVYTEDYLRKGGGRIDADGKGAIWLAAHNKAKTKRPRLRRVG